MNCDENTRTMYLAAEAWLRHMSELRHKVLSYHVLLCGAFFVAIENDLFNSRYVGIAISCSSLLILFWDRRQQKNFQASVIALKNIENEWNKNGSFGSAHFTIEENVNHSRFLLNRTPAFFMSMFYLITTLMGIFLAFFEINFFA